MKVSKTGDPTYPVGLVHDGVLLESISLTDAVKLEQDLKIAISDCRQEHNIQDMPEFNDDSIMPFGKYKGNTMAEVPVGYLHWLWHQGKKEDKVCPVAAYIRKNINTLTVEDPDLIW